MVYVDFADGYYRKNGQPTKEPEDIRYAVRPLRKLYGHTLAREFGPLALKAIRKEYADSGLCRNEVNKRIGKIVRAFKWAVSEELVPPPVHQGLMAVGGLRRGRADVRESEPVRPVAEASVEATRPHVARQVRAMIQLQWHSGMRPGEVVTMRTADLDISGKVWTYRPASHKTEHHGKERVIHLGPKAQAVLQPWLRSEPTTPLFSPSDAVAERNATKRAARKTPVQPSQRNRAKASPAKTAGDAYTVESYRRAIAYGCKKAGIPGWHPHQFRHSAATQLRKEFSLDVARAVLGHSSPAVTAIYAEQDLSKAAEAMERVG